MSTNPFYDQEITDAPRDAATVVLLRETNGLPGQSMHVGLEVFLLRRGGSTTVLNDAYVFPGGKLDPTDNDDEAFARYQVPENAKAMLNESNLSDRRAKALFVAACRETFEETGVLISASTLIPLSRWITPKVPAMMRKRFDTRFFVALAPLDAQAVHDGQEADASEWLPVREALERYRDGVINLAPPQIMTLAGMVSMRNFAQLSQSLQGCLPKTVEPVSLQDNGRRIIVYPGDPRHPVVERAMPGPTYLAFENDRFVPENGYESLLGGGFDN